MSEILPHNWISDELGNIAETITKGTTPTTYGFKFLSEGIKFIKIENINNGSINHETVKQFISEEAGDRLNRSRLRANDVLYTIAGTIGKTAIVCEEDLPANTNQAVAIIRGFNELLSAGFLKYQLASFTSSSLTKKARGGAMNNISLTDLKSHSIIIPPLPEQKRITAKIDCLLAKVDACKARLDKLPEIIKRFRQSVLTDAVSGRLTEEWREKNDEIDGIQLDRIIEQIFQRRLNQQTSSSSKNKIKEIYHQNSIVPSKNLPEQWRYVELKIIAESFAYGSSKKSSKEGEVPVLRMGNIQNSIIDWTDLVFTSDKEEIEKYKLAPGNVLFNRTNSPELVGKTAIYIGEREAIYAGYLIKIETVNELIPEYLNYCLNSPYGRYYCWRVKTDGVSQSNINAQKLGCFKVPFCTIQEQKEIVRRVKALFVIADQLEQKLETARKQIDNLTSSILSKAFRGELVPQDPNDEPAEMLLKRIRSEREALAASKKKGGRTPKKKSGRGKKTSTQKTEAEVEPEPAAPKPAKKSSAKATDGTVRLRKQARKPIEKRFEKADLLIAFRKAVFHRNGLDEDSLLRLVGRRLGVRRISRPIRRELQTAIPTAMRRNIIARNGTGYYGATPSIQHYDDTELIKVLRSVIRKGYEYEREHLTAEAAAYLGFDKVSEAFAEKMKTVFRLAIRRGQLYRNGIYVGKT